MTDNRQDFSFDGIDRQEEEIRDLFNLLTKNDSKESKIVSQPDKSIECVPTVIEPVEESSQIEPDVEPNYQEPSVQLAEEDAQLPEIEQQPAIEEPKEEEPKQEEPFEDEQQWLEQSPESGEQSVDTSSLLIEEDEDDEDNLYADLPPLILTFEEDDWDEDEEASFGDNRIGNFVLPPDEVSYEVDVAPSERRNPLRVLWGALRSNVPLPGDGKREIVRKSSFWTSILVFVFALTYVLYNVWWLPAFTKNMYNGIGEDYHPELVGTVEDTGAYPQRMQLSFQALYNRNPEIRGWLSFHASGNQDFLNIEYPIMYSGDNSKYLTMDFNGNKNKNGALFFDRRAKLTSAEDTNTALIVYGHNMASGEMFAGLNKFIGNVNNARVTTTLTMNTLYTNGQYKVFAVIVTDESAQEEHYYDIRRTQFGSDEEFLGHIEHLRARSLFNYPVDVLAGDELLMLSTCTVSSSAKIRDGRLTVVARKMRPGESTSVDASAIVKNEDVIMPYAWYILQDKQPHTYYSTGEIAASDATTTTSTTTFFYDGMIPTSDDNVSTTLDNSTQTTTVIEDYPNSTTSTSSVSVSDGKPTSTSSVTTSTEAVKSEVTTTTESTTQETTTITETIVETDKTETTVGE